MISTVILARDEREIIEACVARLSWCDDINVVLDPASSDGTREILELLPVRIFEHAFSDFAAQRNWALESISLKYDWVLMLDADELVTDAFAEELRSVVHKNPDKIDAMAICRQTKFLGRWIKRADSFPVWIMRVVRRGIRFESSGHGEVPLPISADRTHRLKQPIEHFAFYKGLAQWIDRHNRYSSREAAQELEVGALFRWRQLLSGDAGERRKNMRNAARHTSLRPILRFLYQYLWKGGFLEGREGFLYCLLLSGYEAQIMAKRMELEQGRSLPAPTPDTKMPNATKMIDSRIVASKQTTSS